MSHDEANCDQLKLSVEATDNHTVEGLVIRYKYDHKQLPSNLQGLRGFMPPEPHGKIMSIHQT